MKNIQHIIATLILVGAAGAGCFYLFLYQALPIHPTKATTNQPLHTSEPALSKQPNKNLIENIAKNDIKISKKTSIAKTSEPSKLNNEFKPLISPMITPLNKNELATVAQQLFLPQEQVFPITIENEKLSSLMTDTTVTLEIPNIGFIDYVINETSQNNNINNLSGHIKGDEKKMNGINISWKDNAFFGSIMTPQGALHLITINNKQYLFFSNESFSD